MELRHIRYLRAVADHGSFSRAADALQVSQPTLSQQIKQLEQSLGVQLLDRSGWTVRLTEAGTAYAEHSRLALRELAAGERAVHDVQDLPRGQVRVSVIPTITAYLTGPLVHRFQRSYPGITLSITEATQSQIEAALLSDRIDLGIDFGGSRTSGISSSHLFVEKLGVILSSANPLARRDSTLTVHDLAHERLALLSRDFATRMRIDDYFAEQSMAPHVTLEGAAALGIGLQLFLPFVLGQILRRLIGDGVARHGSALRYVGRESVVLIVYSAFSGGERDGVWHSVPSTALLRLVLLSTVLVTAMLWLTRFTADLMRFERADVRAIRFYGTKKALVTGLPMAAVLFAGQPVGQIILPLMVFHQVQLTMCAWLANRCRHRVA
ncbi:transcriptional regulator CynR [Rhodococcus opacus]|uniref:transcriptional regulator CynR n=1 Tax=Rhodococcus opacus TaxID=37919 RepID=UPI001FF2A9A8|nr:transcriptional regulator CynR [Rhodococcus opacus]UOT04075.1 transcriptional regulator CynR [Rhodococcus opacus]